MIWKWLDRVFDNPFWNAFLIVTNAREWGSGYRLFGQGWLPGLISIVLAAFFAFDLYETRKAASAQRP